MSGTRPIRGHSERRPSMAATTMATRSHGHSSSRPHVATAPRGHTVYHRIVSHSPIRLLLATATLSLLLALAPSRRHRHCKCIHT